MTKVVSLSPAPSQFSSMPMIEVQDKNACGGSVSSVASLTSLSTNNCKGSRIPNGASSVAASHATHSTASSATPRDHSIAFNSVNSSIYDDLKQAQTRIHAIMISVKDIIRKRLPPMADVLTVLTPLVLAIALRQWRIVTTERAISMQIARKAFPEQAKLVLEETLQRIDTTRKTFQGFGSTVQQIAQFSDQTWPFVSIPHWDLRAEPILEYTNADSLILAPLVDPQQWDSFYDFTDHLHEEKLQWQLHFQPLFVPWQKKSSSLSSGGQQASTAQNLREWYVDPDARRIMDLISKKANPAAVLLRSEHAHFDYLFQPIVLGGEDDSGSQTTRKRNPIQKVLNKIFPMPPAADGDESNANSYGRLPLTRSPGVGDASMAGGQVLTGLGGNEKKASPVGQVVGLVAAQVRLDSLIQASLTPFIKTMISMKQPINVDVVAVLEDNCRNKISFQIVSTPSQQSTSYFLGIGDHHDSAYDEFEIVSKEFSFVTGVNNGRSFFGSAGASTDNDCYPTSMKIHLFPTYQMIG